jgi:hypothetical protein
VSKGKRQIVIEIKDPDVEARLTRIEEMLEALPLLPFFPKKTPALLSALTRT